MIRKLATLSLLALVTSTFFAACANAGAKPNALTGNLTQEQKRHFTDDKGGYHADLAAQDKPLR